MPVNTEALDDGKYVTTSSLSVVASRATIRATDVVARSTLSSGGAVTLDSTLSVAGAATFSAALGMRAGTAILPGIAPNSELSLGFFRSAASHLALSYGQLSVVAGSAILPGYAITSERSLGLYRSAASVLAVSYGRLLADFRSASTLNASGTTTNVTGQGDFYFSVLSLTSNGGEFGFRSGNTTYQFASVAVG